MPPYYYHLKFELYPTPDPTASGAPSKGNGSSSKTTDTTARDDIWVPSPGASIFDDLPAHPRTRHQPANPSPRWDLGQWGTQDHDYHREDRHGDDHHNQYPRATSYAAAAAGNTRVIDCGAQRGKAHVAAAAAVGDGDTYNEDDLDDDGPAGRYGERFPVRVRRSPLPRVADGIGPGRAVTDWRFGKVRIESFDRPDAVGSEMAGKMNGGGGSGSGSGGEVTPAASLGPNLGGMGLATKARYLPLGTKNTEAGWGVVHLYGEGDEENALGGVPEEALEGPGEGNSKGQDGGQEEEEGTMLCIPAVPSYMSPSDFLGFVGEKWRGYVSHYRMVMTSRMSRYMVLMKFRDYRRAKEWKKEFDGKPFDSVEVSRCIGGCAVVFAWVLTVCEQTEICHVTFIKSITVETPSHTSIQRKHSEATSDRFSPTSPMANSLKPFPPPTPNLIELPTCAVCLERMDDTTGLMTILCQHVFHCTCLQTWKGSGCPVCRATNPKPNHDSYDPNNPYSQPFGSGVANICNSCNCTDDLWICLICGNVGCGRYNGGHAKEHWKLTAHSFSLELETQHVWDYAGDMWVHRLIRDKGDGKVVELPRNNTNDRQSGGTAQEDVVPRAKLDNIGMEYTHLLTSQLESQRVYFEEMVNKAADKAAKASAAAESASAQVTEALKQLSVLRAEHRVLKDETVPSLEREVAREKNRAAKSADLARSMGKALQEEKEVSAGLMKRIEHLQSASEGSGQAVEQLRAENQELKEMNRDLTMFISGQEKLREMEKEGLVEQGELEDGTAGVAGVSGRRKGKGKKK